jgi:hypothetical protein
MADNFFKVKKGLNVKPEATPGLSEKGDLGVNSSSGKLEYHNGTTMSPALTEAHTATVTNKSIDSDNNTITNIVNANIKAGAAIAYSKLALTGELVNGDISASAAIAYSKLNLSGSILNADINAAAAIAYSKLNLSGSLVNADISAGAAIARSKVAAGTASHVLINDGDGLLSSEATLAKSRGGSGQDNSSLTFPATGTLATLAGSESLSNKTVVAPVVDDGLDMIEESSLSSPSAGRRRLGLKDDGKLYLRDSSGNEVAVGTGSGLGINYILNPDAEANTSGWSLYADAAGTQPVDGTGGSASINWDRWTTNPLRGTAQFRLVKGGSNYQGQGVSYLMSFSQADQGKQIKISGDYRVESGTFATGDVAIYIVDVTNGTVIQPAGYQIVALNSINGTFTATFQSAINSTSYRLCFHVASTSSSAYTLNFDNIQVGPQNVVYSTPVTDWTDYTPTYSASLGSVTHRFARWRRVGDTVEVQGRFTCGTVTGSLMYMTLPAGMAAKSNSAALDYIVPGSYGSDYTGANVSGIVPFISVANINNIYWTNNNTRSSLGPFNANGPQGNGANVVWSAVVPIEGWSSSTQIVSESNEGRVVAAQYSSTSTGTVTTSVQFMDFATKVTDTVGAVLGAGSGLNGTYTNTWRYVAKVPGVYRVAYNICATSAASAQGVLLNTIVCKNGSQVTGGIFTGIQHGTGAYLVMAQCPGLEVQLNAGDAISVSVANNTTPSNWTLVAGDRTQISVDLIQGNQTVLASEKIVARYKASAAFTTGTSSGRYAWDTKEFDSHNAVTPGGTSPNTTWLFTAPRPGYYRINMAAGKTSSAGSNGSPYCRTSGTGATGNHWFGSQAGNDGQQTGSTLIYLPAGGTFYVDNGTGSANNYISDPANNWVTIESVG